MSFPTLKQAIKNEVSIIGLGDRLGVSFFQARRLSKNEYK